MPVFHSQPIVPLRSSPGDALSAVVLHLSTRSCAAAANASYDERLISMTSIGTFCAVSSQEKSAERWVGGCVDPLTVFEEGLSVSTLVLAPSDSIDRPFHPQGVAPPSSLLPNSPRAAVVRSWSSISAWRPAAPLRDLPPPPPPSGLLPRCHLSCRWPHRSSTRPMSGRPTYALSLTMPRIGLGTSAGRSEGWTRARWMETTGSRKGGAVHS